MRNHPAQDEETRPQIGRLHFKMATADQQEKKVEDKPYTTKKYNCGWCGYIFYQSVRSVMTTKPIGYDQEVSTSSQVRCPFCKNFLRTWKDGEEIEKTKKRVYKW